MTASTAAPMKPIDVLALLHRATAADDAIEHAATFAKAVRGIITADGVATDVERDQINGAIEQAAGRTAQFSGLQLTGPRLEIGALGAGYGAYIWSLFSEIRALKADRMTQDMVDYAAVFANDLDSAARLTALRRREANEPPAELAPFYALTATPPGPGVARN